MVDRHQTETLGIRFYQNKEDSRDLDRLELHKKWLIFSNPVSVRYLLRSSFCYLLVHMHMDSPWKPQVLELKERVVVRCNRSNSVDFNIKLLQTAGELCVWGEEHLICDCFVFMFLVFLAHALYRWEEEEGGNVITSAPSLKIDLLCVGWSSSCCKATALIMIYLSECSSVCVVWHRLELSPRFPGDVTGSHPDSGMGISSA